MIDIAKLNRGLDPNTVLAAIRYEHSRPSRSGRWLRDFCVLCDEIPKKGKVVGSMAIDIDRKFFHCHRCKQTGDLLSLLQRVHGLTLPQALKRAQELAKTTHIAEQSLNSVHDAPSIGDLERKYDSYSRDPDRIASHPYLRRKLTDGGLSVMPTLPKGLRLLSLPDKDFIVVPFRNAGGSLQTMQYISADGEKNFKRGYRMRGGFFLIGEIADRVYVVEGLATGITVSDSLRGCGFENPTVAVAGGVNNLAPVVNELGIKHPQSEFVVVFDRDVVGSERLRLVEKIENPDRVRFVTPPLIEPQKVDFNDMMKLGYSLQEIAEELMDSIPISKIKYFQ